MVNTSRTIYAFAREMYPRHTQQQVQYGTAGFRQKASHLDYVMYRMGLLAVLRGRCKKATVGVMVTASHNPEPDNGVKLVDPQGEMLEHSWEAWATKLANVTDDKLEATVDAIVKHFGITNMTDRVEVYIGKDTRPSSPSLAEAVTHGVLAIGGKPIDFGIVTTPQLHYFVRCRNTAGAYGTPTEVGYYNKLCAAFKKLRGDTHTKGGYENTVVYDGANGVGAKKVKYLQELLGQSLIIEMYNDEIIGSGKLNNGCGADYVKSHQKYPNGLPNKPNVRCCSVDGDADRIVYYYKDEDDNFHLMDGDRIGTLIALYLKDLVEATGLKLEMGVVQTAYANGASTDYISNKLNIPVACTPTGVKHLHHKATQYDIGVYFEANGHGTVVYGNGAKQQLRDALAAPATTNSAREACLTLQHVIDLTNETVGDAIADLLLVETVLHARGWTIRDWEQQYVDLPNRLSGVRVQDRRIFTTTDAERKVATPQGLQARIDTLVGQVQKGRSFVRPSGTEDLVRIYAEAATLNEVDRLIEGVTEAVLQFSASEQEQQ